MKRSPAGLLRDHRAMSAFDTSLGSPYHKRVLQLEDEGLCTSDAQGVADVEFQKHVDACIDSLRLRVRRRAVKSRREAWL